MAANDSGVPPSFVAGTSSRPLQYLTVDEVLKAAVADGAGRPALIVPRQSIRYSFGDLDAEVERVAAGLLACGLNPGDRVGIWAPNCAEWVVTMFAAARAGLILVNINPAYRTSELDFALRLVECRALVFAAVFKGSDYLAMLHELMPELATAPPGQLAAARFPALRVLVQLGAAAPPGCLSFEDLKALGHNHDVSALRDIARAVDPDDPYNIQFTSGTTGTPKGATLTHFNIVNNGYFVGEGMRLTAADRLCIPVPMYHCFGMVLGVLAAMTHGAASIFPGEAFEPLAVLDTVTDERCTALHGVPTMFIAMLEHPRFGDFDLRSLRTGIMAGAPCPISVMRRVIDEMHMPEVTICYGMTETSPVSFQSQHDDPLEMRVTTVGRIHPHVQVKIVDTERQGDAAWHAGRAADARLQRDARLLERSRTHPRCRRCRRLDAHRRPGGHRRAGLLQHRRARQGHDHPWRREHLAARNRGAPVSLPRGAGRGRGRRAGPEVRRGRVRLHPRPRGRAGDRGGDPRLLPRADRPLQGAALRALHG